jgi:fatty-acyl-CoA synthase
MLHNREEFFEVQGAMARLGGAAVSVSWRSTAEELGYLLAHSGARGIFYEAELHPTVTGARSLAQKLPEEGLFPLGAEVPGRPTYEELLASVPDADLDGAEATVVIYTSGTTGRPKGAVRKFGAGQSLGFAAFLDRVPFQHGDRHLCVCPLYHSTGFAFAGMALMLGGTLVLERDFHPERFLAAIEREKVTTTAVVPTMLHRLLALDPEASRRYRTDSLRALVCGGAQLPGPLGVRALERFGPVLYNFYGSTETGIVTCASPDDLRASPGTIGRPLHGVSVRLLDEAGREVPKHTVGELYARSSMLVEGYHDDAKATQASLRDGYFSVGDLGREDADGRYHIVGRRRDMVISGGVNVYPAEVERALDEHPGVAQSAVVGVPDPEWGEKVRAFVVLRPDALVDALALRSWCRERLSGPKVPREWVFLDSLPSNPTGKILKRELTRWDGPVERT